MAQRASLERNGPPSGKSGFGPGYSRGVTEPAGLAGSSRDLIPGFAGSSRELVPRKCGILILTTISLVGRDWHVDEVLGGLEKTEVFGFPSPPQECFPRRDDRVAICGLSVIDRY